MSTSTAQSARAEGLIRVEIDDAVARIALARPHKRNALSDPLVLALRDTFETLPEQVQAVVLHADGEHFCAGLDLSEMVEHDVPGGLAHSRMWHAAFESIQFGRVPVIAALRGAVIGGGLELAASCHIRIAEPSTFYALPEGSRGLFVGGGGSVRITRLNCTPASDRALRTFFTKGFCAMPTTTTGSRSTAAIQKAAALSIGLFIFVLDK